MSAKWKRGFNPEIIIKKLDKIRTINDENVSFSGFEYHQYISVLKSMVEISDDISTDVVGDLVVNGFHTAAKKERLVATDVIASINKSVRDYLDKPHDDYWFVTSINIIRGCSVPRYTYKGCSVRFYDILPKKYNSSRSEFVKRSSSWLRSEDDEKWKYVVAHISEKGPHDAVEKMMDTIDLLRGIWNIRLNKSMVISFGGLKEPVNQLRLGALHTLHDNRGEKKTDIFWYQSEYCKSTSTVDMAENEGDVLYFDKNVRRYLKQHMYKDDIVFAILKYVRSLDYRDYNSVIVSLWSVLEHLTSTLKDGYDKTIRRVCFQYSDREYQKQVLEHLRQYRNKSVHWGDGEKDIETHVYQLKGFVEKLLLFHITNPFGFNSLEEASEFMDLTSDVSLLKKQIGLCKAKIKFMTN